MNQNSTFAVNYRQSEKKISSPLGMACSIPWKNYTSCPVTAKAFYAQHKYKHAYIPIWSSYTFRQLHKIKQIHIPKIK